MQIESVVEIPQNPTRDEPQRDCQPQRMACAVEKQPREEPKDRGDRDDRKKPTVALAKPKDRTLIDRRFDSKIVFNPPGRWLLSWQSLPGKNPILGDQIEACSEGCKKAENQDAA